MKYQCEDCEKTFTHLGHYKRHSERIRQCNKTSDYMCERCEKSFRDKTKYTKHLNRKFPCKSAEEIAKEKEIDDLKLRHKCEVLELKNQVLEMKMMLNGTTTNIAGNNNNVTNINDHSITNNITNNNNTNLVVNNYGKENLSYITPEMARKYNLQGIKGEILLFEYIHFNADHPENMNLKLCDIARDKIGVVTGISADGKKIWAFITSEQLTRNHQEQSHELFRLDMVDRGVGNVPDEEIKNLLELATPSSDHRDKTRKGLIEVMQKHKNKIK